MMKAKAPSPGSIPKECTVLLRDLDAKFGIIKLRNVGKL
jgi:hypothetical protein